MTSGMGCRLVPSSESFAWWKSPRYGIPSRPILGLVNVEGEIVPSTMSASASAMMVLRSSLSTNSFSRARTSGAWPWQWIASPGWKPTRCEHGKRKRVCFARFEICRRCSQTSGRPDLYSRSGILPFHGRKCGARRGARTNPDRPMKAANLSDDALSSLSRMVTERLGLDFPRERWADLRRGLATAADRIGADDVQVYAQSLLAVPPNPSDLNHLAQALTVGETYFFRERHSIELLAGRILPELTGQCQREGRKLRIWCAGCCTGEEPYSMGDSARSPVFRLGRAKRQHPGHGPEHGIPEDRGPRRLQQLVIPVRPSLAEGRLFHRKRKSLFRNRTAHSRARDLRSAQPRRRSLSCAGLRSRRV